METDSICLRCGGSLARGGLTPTRIANGTAIVFAVLMVVYLLTVAIPQTRGSRPNTPRSVFVQDAATQAASYIFILGATVTGWVIGRTVGAVICRGR